MNKMTNTRRPVARQKAAPQTEEERQERIVRFLSQRREGFSANILYHLCRNPFSVFVNRKKLVEQAVDMGDYLMEKLYPVAEVKKEEEE